ncbi:TetR/AcrR family transcriptional regulator [Nocardia sp. NBC_01388]|uniref:TetR/AcrR family transcriptional regulator n=1 Tax=Nocardia sp. NBC_01388 TaxID=2903596 RepID=UPI00324A31F6
MARQRDDAGTRRSYGGLSSEERAAQRRERLLEAALELFGTQGYAASPIERLCTEGGISTRSFYEEMGSREALLIALVDQITSRAVQRALEVLANVRDQPLTVQVAECVRAYLEVTCHDRRSAKVCYVEVIGVSSAVEDWRREKRLLISGMLAREAEQSAARGEISARRFDLFALAIIGAVNSLAQELVQTTDPGTEITLDEICDEIAYLVNYGLSAS